MTEKIGAAEDAIVSLVRDHPHLYHYTTEAGLKGIVESNSLWATYFRDMNDATEIHELRAPLVRELARRLTPFVNERRRKGIPVSKTVSMSGGEAEYFARGRPFSRITRRTHRRRRIERRHLADDEPVALARRLSGSRSEGTRPPKIGNRFDGLACPRAHIPHGRLHNGARAPDRSCSGKPIVCLNAPCGRPLRAARLCRPPDRSSAGGAAG
jgi:hypothetical protein